MKKRIRIFETYNFMAYLLILNFLITGLVSVAADINEDYDFQGDYGIFNLVDLTTKGPWVDIRAFGASTSATNNLTAIEAAITYAKNNGIGTVLIPSGTFDFNGPITGLDQGMTLMGLGEKKSILNNTNTSGGSAIEVTGKSISALTIRDLRINGESGGGHGIYIHDNNYTSFNITLENLWIAYCGGKGVYIPDQYSSTLRRIYVDYTEDNAIEINGNVATLLDSCYVLHVASGKTGYRIYSGNPTLISCNGISSGDSWGIFGSTLAEDGVSAACYPLFQGCNIEDFADYGIKIKDNSSATFINTSFYAPNTTGTVSGAVICNYTDKPMLFMNTTISSKGATYSSKITGLFIFYSPRTYTDFETVKSGSTYSNPIITASYEAYLTNALKVNNMAVTKYFTLPKEAPDYFATGCLYYDNTDHIVRYWDAATGDSTYSSSGAQPIAGRAAQTTVTSNYTAALRDQTVLINASSNAVTISLMPLADALVGKRLTFVRTDTSSNTVTIDGDGSETINGSASVYLSSQWERMTLESSSGGWIVVSN